MSECKNCFPQLSSKQYFEAHRRSQVSRILSSGFVYRQQLCLTGINEASSAGEIKHERTTCWVISRTQTHKIYVVRQLAYSTELLVCINEAYKQYKQRGGEKTLLNSTLHSQALSSLLYVLFVFHSAIRFSTDYTGSH